MNITNYIRCGYKSEKKKYKLTIKMKQNKK